MSIVTAAGLTKRFRRARKEPGLAGALRHLIRPRHEDVTAVDRVALNIDEGESVAYVGPNGAGKSTTIKLLTGILVPTSGSVDVCGIEPHRDRQTNARNISVVFGQRTQLWWDIPVIESFRLLGDIYAVPADSYRSSWPGARPLPAWPTTRRRSASIFSASNVMYVSWCLLHKESGAELRRQRSQHAGQVVSGTASRQAG